MKLLCGVVFGVVLGCTLTMSAVAHELPNVSLNSGKSVAVATSFTLSGSQIDASFNNYGQFFEYNEWLDYKRAAEGLPPVKGETCGDQMVTVKTCGQVDHFYQAAMVGASTCNAYAQLHAASYPDGLTARFTAPSSFVDNLDAAVGHHQYYDRAQGISFDCVYPVLDLEPVEELPAQVRF